MFYCVRIYIYIYIIHTLIPTHTCVWLKEYTFDNKSESPKVDTMVASWSWCCLPVVLVLSQVGRQVVSGHASSTSVGGEGVRGGGNGGIESATLQKLTLLKSYESSDESFFPFLRLLALPVLLVPRFDLGTSLPRWVNSLLRRETT